MEIVTLAKAIPKKNDGQKLWPVLAVGANGTKTPKVAAQAPTFHGQGLR